MHDYGTNDYVTPDKLNQPHGFEGYAEQLKEKIRQQERQAEKLAKRYGTAYLGRTKLDEDGSITAPNVRTRIGPNGGLPVKPGYRYTRGGYSYPAK